MLDKPADPPNETLMPFIGRVLQHVPGVSITIERTLSLDEDLLLADHVFVHAPGVKPASACLPVAPMTVSLEIMAETAACLAPDNGLIGLENIKATRWIELADTGQVALRITARLKSFDLEREIYRIETAIYVGSQTTPTIGAEVLFAHRYRLDLSFSFRELSNIHLHRLTAADIYRERLLFHGPSFQCLTGKILLGDEGVVGELRVQPATGLFDSVRQPQLLTDPVILDGVGQLIGLWAMERDRYVFPIGVEKIELYRPTPPVGTFAPVRAEITSDNTKTLRANIEVQDGAGAVWMRILGWTKWKFRWDERLVNFRRQPTRHLVSQAFDLPGPASGAVCRMFTAKDLSTFDASLLARNCLHIDEMTEFTAKVEFPQRQQQWLLGRVAAKDAVRAWLSHDAKVEEMLHPAAFAIVNDARGQPETKYLPKRVPPVKISIAHCDDRAIAVAHDESMGVDIEPIRGRDPGFLETIATREEQALLKGLCGDAAPPAEWITRLWCAKEAAGKLMGTGVNGAPRQFEAKAIAKDGVFQIKPRHGVAIVHVATTRNEGFIVAYATGASSPFRKV